MFSSVIFFFYQILLKNRAKISFLNRNMIKKSRNSILLQTLIKSNTIILIMIYNSSDKKLPQDIHPLSIYNVFMKLRFFFLPISVLICIFLFSACREQLSTSKELQPVEVEALAVQETQEIVSQHYVGTIEAMSSSSLSFPISGNIVRIYVVEGQRVKKGDLIAELDDKNYASSYAAAQATLHQAQDTYNRLKKLHEKGSITEVQWVEIETKLAQAQSTEAISYKTMENCKLYAPYSGVIGKVDVAVGMNILPSLPCFTILQINEVEVKIPIPENIVSNIHIGQSVQVSVSALNNQIFNGKISSKGVVANPLSHNYEVTVPLQNPHQNLMPGMVCNVLIQPTDSTRNIVLPNQTVKITQSGQHFVWTVKNGVAMQQFVTVGGLSQMGTIINTGLSLYDTVIVNGTQKISNGSPIIIK